MGAGFHRHTGPWRGRRPAGERGQETLAVFLPTTPNPTSGFLLFVPKDDVIILHMGVEDAAKLVISAGLVTPKYQEKLQALADKARKTRSGQARPFQATKTSPAKAGGARAKSVTKGAAKAEPKAPRKRERRPAKTD